MSAMASRVSYAFDFDADGEHEVVFLVFTIAACVNFTHSSEKKHIQTRFWSVEVGHLSMIRCGVMVMDSVMMMQPHSPDLAVIGQFLCGCRMC